MPSYRAQPLATAAGPAPPPTAAPEEQMELDPTGQKPHGYYRDKFWGTLAPVTKEIEYNGHRVAITIRILEADEARQCAHFAYTRSGGHPDSDEYLQARTIFHIATSLEAVQGLALSTECTTFEQRLQHAAEIAETAQEAIIVAYDECRYEPIALLADMAEDAENFAQPPGGTGNSSAQVASLQEA